MRTFSWLHLTDLHCGMSPQAHLWPNVADAYFEDLAWLRQKCGPWELVTFTGDLVQRGSQEEFARLDAAILQPLWEHLARLDSSPVLLAVPGNHDLQRPDSKALSAAQMVLTLPGGFRAIEEEFWEKDSCEYRQVIDTAFASYQRWSRDTPHTKGIAIEPGLLPGDFSATLERNGLRIGVMGLNVAFLQLLGGDYQKRLTCDIRQAHRASGGDLPAWAKAHDACLLLTHHGLDWLDDRGRQQMETEINPSGRFAVHLFGHMHQPRLRGESHGGGPMRHLWQGASLFGLEHYGEGQNEERIHGYAAGRMEVEDGQMYMRAWPRKAVRDDNGWRFVPDHSYVLDPDDQGTRRILIGPAPRHDGPRPPVERAAGLAGTHDQERARRALLASYSHGLLKRCDIVDLAGLPEGDVHLATRQFSLRNLFVPLHVNVEAAAPEAVTHSDMEALRLEQRQRDAGRRPRTERKDLERREMAGPHSIGARLMSARRLLVLGDPGGGKSTLLRWIATAYLLQQTKDPHLDRVPAIDTLPRQDLWPILIRCRDLSPDTLQSVTLEGILRQALAKLELPSFHAQQREELGATLRDLLAQGRAILLIDGLDEIMDRSLRARFCEQLEVIATQYDQAYIVITSRVVGYREMRRSLVHRFEHLLIADLSPADKDRFIASWCEITEPERRQWAMRELENAVHSSERIERLTGNPMLLTTLALVKRKVGKLPSRRHELYREAVDVLLHWRHEIGDLLDREEALPQLQYVAYAMCRDGLTQLRRDQILSHLEDMRAAHANIRPLQKHSPEEFLALLEERTSLLMQAGEVMHHGEPVPVFEFRHLTFQEYLAALALVQGRFPGHTRSTLAERVAPLAGQVSARDPQDEDSVAVSEHWHEPLRLCVGCCNDDDVDDVLRAIATPLSGEDDARTARPRAILAAWCLADEPNASEDAAAQVLQAFARQLRAADRYTSPHHTSLAIDAALALFDSDWAGALESALIEEFIRRAPPERAIAGGLASIAEKRALPADRADMTRWLMDRVTRIEHGTENERIAAALGIMEAACIGRVHMVPRLIEALLALLQRGPAAAHAASWALAWLHEHVDHFGVWHPTDEDVSQLVAFIGQPDSDPEALQWVLAILGRAGSRAAADACIRLLRHPRAPVASAAAYNLAHGDVDLVTGPLLECLKAPVFHNEVLGAAAYALGALGHLPALQRVFDWMNSGDIPGHLAQSVHTGLSDRDANGVTALQRMDGAALADSMLGYLQDTEMSSSVRGVAAWILGELRDARAVEPLLACLSDGASSLELRDDAAFALGHIGDSRAVEPLLACLQDSSPPDDELSRSALTALGRIRDARVIEPLLACLERFAPTSVMNEAVCASIVQTLGLFRDERIIQPLLDRLTVDLRLEAANQKANDEMYPWLPATILQVLAKFDPSRVAPGLQVALQIPGVEPSTRSLLIHALGEMGGFPSAEPLRAMLRDPAEAAEVRAAAARALGRMRYLEAFELLVQYALEHEDVVAPHMPEVEPHKYGPYLGGFYYNTGGSALQLAAVEALSMLDDPRCREPLVRTLRAPSSRARLEALQGLLKMRRDALDSGLVLENIHYTSLLLDPQYTVFSQARMRRQARSLGLPLEEIQRRYEALARDYDLLIEAP